MRFILAAVAFVAGVVALVIGGVQYTQSSSISEVTATGTSDSAAPLTVIGNETLSSRAGTQSVHLEGEGPIFVAVGRTDDVNAWVGETLHNTVTIDEAVENTSDHEETLAFAESGTEPTAPNPAGNDLWFEEHTAENVLDFEVVVSPGYSLLIASDGTEPAPSSITISWPFGGYAPLVGPLLTGGGILILIAALLLLWAILHRRKVRRIEASAERRAARRAARRELAASTMPANRADGTWTPVRWADDIGEPTADQTIEEVLAPAEGANGEEAPDGGAPAEFDAALVGDGRAAEDVQVASAEAEDRPAGPASFEQPIHSPFAPPQAEGVRTSPDEAAAPAEAAPDAAQERAPEPAKPASERAPEPAGESDAAQTVPAASEPEPLRRSRRRAALRGEGAPADPSTPQLESEAGGETLPVEEAAARQPSSEARGPQSTTPVPAPEQAAPAMHPAPESIADAPKPAEPKPAEPKPAETPAEADQVNGDDEPKQTEPPAGPDQSNGDDDTKWRRPRGRNRSSAPKQRFLLAPAATIVVALGLSGCAPQYWPASWTDTEMEPTGTPASTVDAAILEEGANPPTLNEAQLDSAVENAAAVAAQADEALDADLLDPRFTGDALAERTALYEARSADSEMPAPAPFPTGEVVYAIPETSDTWPRVVFAVVNPAEDAAEGATPVALMLVQESVRSNFKVASLTSLAPNVVLPEAAPVSVGAPSIANSDAELVMEPDQIAAAYADIIANGEDSEYADRFDAENDVFRTQVNDEYRSQLEEELDPEVVSISFAYAATDTAPIGITSIDGGAIVAVSITETETLEAANDRALITVSGRTAVLSGVETSDTGFERTYTDQLLFFVPSAEAGGAVQFLGVSQAMTDATELSD
ncbi:hypothetical protein [Gulosibacter sp. 10]|uniref:hypothetical protein n=1 Tax=Gulosibacter sp. 10 TaxID=1255570 RepID=UPI00097E7CD3|nr:hypothetical protein [Gulosibacter sp. 10]SJM52141.1 hypothetical protein FM112_02410 [Gulosibacter sp. 10]